MEERDHINRFLLDGGPHRSQYLKWWSGFNFEVFTWWWSRSDLAQGINPPLTSECQDGYFPLCHMCHIYQGSVFWGFQLNSFFCCCGCVFRAAPVALGGSQAMGQVGAIAAANHSSMGSKPTLWPTPQLMATLDPWPIERDQGLNLPPYGY